MLIYKAYRIRSREYGAEMPECFTWIWGASPVDWLTFRAGLITRLAPIAPRIRRLEFRSYGGGLMLNAVMNDERKSPVGYTTK